MSRSSAKRAAEILNRILYITIASVTEGGEPWNSPVYSAFDKDLNFYWSSDKDGQHSQNVRANSRVFLVVYDSTVPESTGEGVYIQASATELQDATDIMIARQATQARKGQLDELTDDEHTKFLGKYIRRVYKAIPQKIWMNDVELDENGKYIRDIRVEIPIKELKQTLKEL